MQRVPAGFGNCHSVYAVQAWQSLEQLQMVGHTEDFGSRERMQYLHTMMNLSATQQVGFWKRQSEIACEVSIQFLCYPIFVQKKLRDQSWFALANQACM